MRKKIALILAGCGVKDGSEIHETIALMLAIRKVGFEYELFAPNTNVESVNHLTGNVTENRNVLVESARIARGEIRDLQELKVEGFASVVIPGGFGAAKNLCTYATEGANLKVQPDLERILKKTNELRKPIGAMCIAPVILAKVFPGAIITLGDYNNAAKDMEKIGAVALIKGNGQVAIDKNYNIFSVPGYMLNADIVQIFEDAEQLINEIISFLKETGI